MHGTHSALRTIQPVRPAAPYVGGKRLLASSIIERINTIDHTLYAEPFVGMGGVFFRRDQIPPCEIINDYSGDVANFFRVLQRHHSHFMDVMQFQLTSRREFERLLAIDPTTLTDLERAARFLFLQKTTFGGKLTSRTFSVSTSFSGKFNVRKLASVLDEIHTRLASVVIENLPYQQFIDRYDSPTTLFYLDPPYWGFENYYGKNLFERADYDRLAQQLANIRGRFILSINDTPGVRETFAQFRIDSVPAIYTSRTGSPKRTHELLISDA